MKKTHYIVWAFAACVALTSCKDYLTEIEPGTTRLEDYFTSTAAAIADINGCYVPLMWEYNNTYCSEWFIGDIAGDDALKGGGSTSDMADAYDIENWRTTSQNTLLLDFYRAQYIGIGRCNLAIKYISNMCIGIDDEFTESMKNRLLGEAYYLRAYYYFRLVRIYAGVPLVTEVIDEESKWGQPRASVDAVYTQILADLTIANDYLWVRSRLDNDNLGRATKGAAQAMLMKTNLYMASSYWQKQGVSKSSSDCYKDAKAWGDSILSSGEYTLCPNYEDNFTIAGENGQESVFEIQYAEEDWGDYGDGNDPYKFGYTSGSFTQILVRSRSTRIGGGWGFNKPTQNLYNEFESADTIRRDVAILNPPDSLIETPAQEIYLGSRYLNNKYAMYRDTVKGAGFGQWNIHASRGPLNNRQIRYADVLLFYAEACLYSGDEATAKTYINKVRQRVGLGEVDTYKISLNGGDSIVPTTEQALRHERRMELAMEGHRWFDLVRWEGVDGNGLKEHMDAYAKTESTEAQSHMQKFVKGKHELFPIPQEEIQLNPTTMTQNAGY